MKFRDNLAPRVNLDIDVWDVDGGGLVYHEETHNLATLTGRNLIRDLLYWNSTADGSQPSGLNRFAIGTSTAAPAASDTVLGSEVFRDSFTQRTKSDGQTVYKYYLASGSANGSTVGEAGLFGNGASTALNNGTLYAHAVHTPIAKSASVAITYTWTLTWADDGI